MVNHVQFVIVCVTENKMQQNKQKITNDHPNETKKKLKHSTAIDDVQTHDMRRTEGCANNQNL